MGLRIKDRVLIHEDESVGRAVDRQILLKKAAECWANRHLDDNEFKQGEFLKKFDKIKRLTISNTAQDLTLDCVEKIHKVDNSSVHDERSFDKKKLIDLL